MHPGLLQVALGACIISADVLFLIVLVTVGNEGPKDRYLCKGNHTDMEICWNWDFGRNNETCMFNLLFAATICLHVAIFIYLMGSILKCLFPEFAMIAHQSLFFRCTGRYFSVLLNFAACITSSALLVFIVVHDNSSNSSCSNSGHLWKNCQDHNNTCWVFVILATGCICSLLATFLSACDARLMYIGKRDFEEQERIYQIYVDYSAIRDLDNF